MCVCSSDLVGVVGLVLLQKLHDLPARLVALGLPAFILGAPLFLAPAWLCAQSDFPAQDRNNDRVIDRGEWDGTRAAFRRHDTNRDGVLSGNEIPGWFYDRSNGRNTTDRNSTEMSDLSRSTVQDLDRNGNGYIDRWEWRGRTADFRTMDRDRDGRVSDREFYANRDNLNRDDVNGDNLSQNQRTTSRARAVDRLDKNNNSRIEGYEWPYNTDLFHQLDTNHDSTLTEDELRNMSNATLTQLDRNKNGRVDTDEWPGGFATFRDLDENNDGRVNADEYFTRGGSWQRQQRFRQWDRNGDGIIQSTEWKSARDLFHRLDTNRNSQIEWSEFEADQQSYLTPNR